MRDIRKKLMFRGYCSKGHPSQRWTRRLLRDLRKLEAA